MSDEELEAARRHVATYGTRDDAERHMALLIREVDRLRAVESQRDLLLAQSKQHLAERSASPSTASYERALAVYKAWAKPGFDKESGYLKLVEDYAAAIDAALALARELCEEPDIGKRYARARAAGVLD